ncbi:MAG: metallophosphoesterase [Phycisphaerales bacterium]|nr:metallophosphoesterase [Phycisphaerales bacterium]
MTKCIANVFNMLCAPGWAIINKLTGNWHMDSVKVATLAASVSWTGWFAGFGVLAAIRRGAYKAGATRAFRNLETTRASGSATGSSNDSAIARSARDAAPISPSRRRFLFDGTLGLGCVSTLGVGADATLVEPWDLRVTSYDIPIAGLPDSLVGLKLVQLSDTHLGPRIPASFIREAVAQTLALSPDIVLLTGDYVHNGSAWIAPAAKVFEPLVAPGRVVVGVLGNHDWWAGGERMSEALTHIGVRMIDNSRCFFDRASRTLNADPDPSRRDQLCLCGVGDLKEDRVDFNAALADVPDFMPRLMLAHRPDTAELPEMHSPRPPRIDLMLCGHTHGGQVRLPILGTPMVPSRYGSKYAAGLVQGPACRVLVSRGVGMSILPLRFGVPPEIVEITLTRAPSAPNNPA